MAGEDILKFNNGQTFSFSNFKEIREEDLKNADAETKRLFNIFAGDDHILQADEAVNLWNKIKTAAATNKTGDNSVFDNDEIQDFLDNDSDIKNTDSKFSINAFTNFVSQIFTESAAVPSQKATPEQVAHACQENVIQIIDDNISEAEEIFQSQSLGAISGAYDDNKDDNDKLKTSNVKKVLDYQKAGEIQMIEAKNGNLTKRAYYEENKQRIKDIILTRLTILESSSGVNFLDQLRGKYSKEQLTKIISDYIDTICNNVEMDKLKEMQKQFVSFSTIEEISALQNFVNNAVDYSQNHSEIKIDTMGGEGKPRTIKNPKGIIPSYWDSAEPITFEEVYKIERGTEYSQYKVEQYVLAKKEMETVANAYNKKQQFIEGAKAIIENKEFSVDEKLQQIMELYSEFYALCEDGGLSELQKIIESSNTLIKLNENGIDLSAYRTNEQMKQSALNKLLKTAISQKEADFEEFLGGKTIEEYQEAMENAAKDILGEDNAKMLSEAMKNDNMTVIQRWTGNVSMAGMGMTVVGGILCFTPLAPLGAALVTVGNVTAISGMAAKTGLGVADYATKEVKTSEELEGLAKDFVMDAGGFIIGMGAGKAGMKAFSKLIDKKLSAVFAKEITAGNRMQALKTVLKNPEYLKNFMTAAGAKISTDFLISYVGDLAMMGMLDTDDDWRSLLQANLTGILVGMSGDIKDAAGVGKGTQVKPSSGTTSGRPLTQQDYAMSVLGKEVNVKDSANGAEITGTVTRVTTEQGITKVEVNGKEYSTDDVVGIKNDIILDNREHFITELKKNKTLQEQNINTLLELIKNRYNNEPKIAKQILNLSNRGYDVEAIVTYVDFVSRYPELTDIVMAEAPQYQFLDTVFDKPTAEALEKRQKYREKIKMIDAEGLENLERTLGQQFASDIRWEEIISDNTTAEQIKQSLVELNDKSKFFNKQNSMNYAFYKNIKWAHEVNMIEQIAEFLVSKSKNPPEFQTIINLISSGYRYFDAADNKHKFNHTDYQHRGELRPEGSSSVSTSFNNSADSYGGNGYFEDFTKSQYREMKHKGVSLTMPQIIDSTHGKLQHPDASTSKVAFKVVGKIYNTLLPLVKKVQSGEKLTEKEIQFVDENIAEMHFILANAMPWARGSAGISEIFTRTMYGSLGINKPAVREGFSLDLEAFAAMDFNEYKAKWNTFFEDDNVEPNHRIDKGVIEEEELHVPVLEEDIVGIIAEEDLPVPVLEAEEKIAEREIYQEKDIIQEEALGIDNNPQVSQIKKIKLTPEQLSVYQRAVTLIGEQNANTLLNYHKLNNPEELRFKPEDVEILAQAFKANPKFCNILLGAKRKGVQEFRFDAGEIKALIKAAKLNPEFVKKLINEKSPDGNNFRHNGYDIKALVDANSFAPEFISKNLENPNYSGVDLKNIATVKTNKPQLFKQILEMNKNRMGSYQTRKELFAAAAKNPETVTKILNMTYSKDGKKFFLFNAADVAKYAEFTKVEDLPILLQKAQETKIPFKLLLLYHAGLKGDMEATNNAVLRQLKAKDYQEEKNYILTINAFSKDVTSFKNQDGTIIRVDNEGHIQSEYKTISSDEFVNDFGNVDFMVSSTRNISVKNITNDKGEQIYKEYRVPSKAYPGKFEIWRKTPEGAKYKVGLIETTSDGITTIERTTASPEGTKTDYFYAENPADNSRMTYTKITDPEGNVIFENRQKFKVIDENHFQSVENGQTYDIQYFENKVVVTRGDGEKVEISIGGNEINEEGVFSRELLPLIKQLPGSIYFNISKKGLTKVGRNIAGVADNNAFYRASDNLITLSDMHSKLFTLLHEAGHYIDTTKNEKIRTNKELLEIYNSEKEAFLKNEAVSGINKTDYFVDGKSKSSAGGIGEMIAETNALLYSNNQTANIEERGMYLQEYFPKTFAKIAELLTQE